MYAIVQLGGRQWKVEPGTTLEINRLPLEVGAKHTVEQVLFARDGEAVSIGRPFVSGAAVVCEVKEHKLGPKVISFHYRRRENWRKKHGHRQALTQLVVTEISLNGKKATAAEKPAVEKKEKVAKPKAAEAAKVTQAPKKAAKPKTITKSKAAEKPKAARTRK